MYLSAGQCCGHNISKGPPQRPRIIFVFHIPDKRIYLAILFGYFILSSLCLAILSGCSVGLPCLVALLGCPVWSPCWVALSGRPVLLPCWVTLPDSFFASPVRAAASFWRHSIFAQPPERYRLDRFPEHKKWLRHFYLCPSGEGISYKVKKNPANRILRLRGGARQRHASPPPQCDYCFFTIWEIRRTFLYGFGCQKVFPAMPLGR